MLGRLVRTYGVRFAVALILTLALLILSAETIQSQGPVELDIGHDANIPWNIPTFTRVVLAMLRLSCSIPATPMDLSISRYTTSSIPKV